MLSKSFSERSPRHIFHCQKWLTRYFSRLVQNYDVRMMQSRYSFRLAQEAMPLILRSVAAVPNHFQSDQSVQTDMPRFENLTHRPVPEGLDQLILAESFASRIFQRMVQPNSTAKSSRRFRQEITRQTFVLPSAPMLWLHQSHAFQTVQANPIAPVDSERSAALRASRSHVPHSTKLTALANDDLDTRSCIESLAVLFSRFAKKAFLATSLVT
jgi:hypothetical protein